MLAFEWIYVYIYVHMYLNVTNQKHVIKQIPVTQ